MGSFKYLELVCFSWRISSIEYSRSDVLSLLEIFSCRNQQTYLSFYVEEFFRKDGGGEFSFKIY